MPADISAPPPTPLAGAARAAGAKSQIPQLSSLGVELGT
jgi:hypothetical protein